MKSASLYESIGDVLHITGQQEEARQAYQSALACCASQDLIGQACLYRKIAETMEEPGRHEEMLSTYRMAERILGAGIRRTRNGVVAGVGAGATRAIGATVITWAHVPEMTTIIERAQPFVEQYATAGSTWPLLHRRRFQELEA